MFYLTDQFLLFPLKKKLAANILGNICVKGHIKQKSNLDYLRSLEKMFNANFLWKKDVCHCRSSLNILVGVSLLDMQSQLNVLKRRNQINCPIFGLSHLYTVVQL